MLLPAQRTPIKKHPAAQCRKSDCIYFLYIIPIAWPACNHILETFWLKLITTARPFVSKPSPPKPGHALQPKRRSPARPPFWKGRRRQRIRSFRRPGGSGVQLASSDAVVRVTGLEPARLAAREPKSRMSANSIIPAYLYEKSLLHTQQAFVERLTRLELATSTLARWRSTG